MSNNNKIRDLDIKLEIINKLVEAIDKYPQERIGQIIWNCIYRHFERDMDIFNIEDRQMLESLNKRLR